MTDNNNLQAEVNKMILSASGWRKIFTETGDSEDSSPQVKSSDKRLVCLAAASFLSFLEDSYPKINTIAAGRDSRPTGKALQEVVVRVLSGSRFNAEVIGCAAAPEIMAYAKKRNAAFIYISASHNPVGYNGIKFGLNTGGVINAEQSKTLISIFLKKCTEKNADENAEHILNSVNTDAIKNINSQIHVFKRQALNAYFDFSKEVIAGTDSGQTQNAFFALCKKNAEKAAAKKKPFCIAADFNGSARAVSIDRSFFESCGIALIGKAETEGDIRHSILPEGGNLQFCASEIERLRKNGKTLFEKNCFLGYMPDCDGDRGNIVYWSAKQKKACALEAQDVFALSVIAELSYLSYIQNETGKCAVAVNGPTSLRIEEIASCFNAEVFRAEVGEANVVNLAAELRRKGYTVRILGEGSNGGNITHPSSVRDPLNTVFAIMKFFLLQSKNGQKGLFEIWCGKSKAQKKYKPDFSLDDIIETIPRYATTPVGEKRAMLNIGENDHAALKRRYQKIFEKEWAQKKEYLNAKFGITSYRSFCNNGTVQTEDLKDFGVSQKGGLKIQFYNIEKKAVGFIWMRGSGTESVFRIMADIKNGSPEAEKYFAEWQGEMVKKADNTKE